MPDPGDLPGPDPEPTSHKDVFGAIDEESIKNLISQLGFKMAEQNDDGSSHWQRNPGIAGGVYDTVFIDPIGNPNPEGSDPTPISPGILVRISNPERKTWDNHQFTFGKHTLADVGRVIT
jgi:hypothetical protein